jgi:hypothetical protein
MAELGHGAVQASKRVVELARCYSRVKTASEKSEETMSRFAVLLSVAILFAAVGTTQAGQYGTPEEAKALLEKAVEAVK